MIKSILQEKSKELIGKWSSLLSEPDKFSQVISHYHSVYPGWTDFQVSNEILGEFRNWKMLSWMLNDAQTIHFSHDQASIFVNIADEYKEPLEYKLPFKYTLVEFDKPIDIEIVDYSKSAVPVKDNIIGLVLTQAINTPEMVHDMLNNTKNPRLTLPESALIPGAIINTCIFVFSDMNIGRVSWFSDSPYDTLDQESQIRSNEVDEQLLKQKRNIKNLALCCIGYINCENIYLEKQGEVAEAVNRKREVKGKSRLEPYYVCRIKGVQYDGHAAGTGIKHGIRYDVRGHFRRLDSGKTIWVRPHQRGVQNELYIPKVYNVGEGSKPGWKTDKAKGE